MSFLPRRTRIALEHEGRLLDIEIVLATSFWGRLRGLILAGALPPGTGLLLAPCNNIHTLGMTEPIEAVFVSKDWRILKISGPLKPWRAMSACRGAWGVIEWAPGQATRLGLREGAQLTRLTVQPSSPSQERTP